MTTAQTTPAADGGYAEAHTFANALRSVADVIDDGDVAVPRSGVHIFCTAFGLDGRAAFLAARRAFPAAPVTIGQGPAFDHYVVIQVGKGVDLMFDKHALGTKTTVQRPVEEYVIDPELLAPVSA